MGRYLVLAFKNAFRQKKRAITLGINYTVVTLLLVLVFAFSNGVKVNITSNLVRGTAGHLTVSGEYVIDRRAFLGVRAYERITETVKKLFPDSTVIKRYNFSSALYYKNISKRLSFIGIDAGIDTSFNDQIAFAEGSWEDFLSTPNAVILPRSVAEYFELKNKEEVLIARRTRFGAFNTGTLKIAGIHNTANYFLSELVLCHFDYLQQLDLAGKDTATNLFVYFKDTAGIPEKRDRLVAALGAGGFQVSKPKSSDEALAAITAASPRYTVEETDQEVIRLTVSTLDEVLSIISTVLAAVNGVGAFVAFILLFIIAVSIFINLRMTINERLTEIGTMRAMGMEASRVTLLFILENIFLSLIFSVIGIAIGFMLIAVLELFVRLPASGQIAVILSGGKLVLIPTAFDIFFILAMVTVFTAVFSFFPARYGGRIKPVEALTSTF